MAKYYYCPICGKTIFPDTEICPNCKNYTIGIESLHDEEYYINKSISLIGNPSYARQILIDEEASHGPLYDPNTKKYNAEHKYNKKVGQIFTEKMVEQTYIPKCPTCGSTNIKNISALKRVAGAYAFGLFSKTARSQFECLNCHYKW